jgi:hypothetical protein
VPPAAPEEKESWGRLAAFGGQLSAPSGDAKVVGAIKPQDRVAKARPLARMPAESFRQLTQADLQRAFVLKEILEPPLALRD